MNPHTLELITDLRHRLHEEPELSMQESGTKQRLIDFLRAYSRLEIVDRGRWFYAAYRAGEGLPNLAFRADMDALPMEEAPDFRPYASRHPGKAHKCGHDGHCAALAGLALVLDEEQPRCNVFLLFQHAEETGQGAAECLPFLAENGISDIYAIHNMPGLQEGALSICEGPVQPASEGLILSFTGWPSHASNPEKGLNPAFAISKLVLATEALQTSQRWQGFVRITVIAVNVGEHAFGMSPAEGELLLTIRAENEREMDCLRDEILGMAKQLAEAEGLSFRYAIEDYFPETRNHAVSVRRARQAAEDAGIPLRELPEPDRASDDFGAFLKDVPGAMCFMGTGNGTPLHTRDFDFNDRILEPMLHFYRRLIRLTAEAAEG